MIAISRMAMFCQAAKFPIQIVREDNQNGRQDDQPDYVSCKKMLYY